MTCTAVWYITADVLQYQHVGKVRAHQRGSMLWSINMIRSDTVAALKASLYSTSSVSWAPYHLSTLIIARNNEQIKWSESSTCCFKQKYFLLHKKILWYLINQIPQYFVFFCAYRRAFLFHGTDQNGVECMHEAAGLLSLFSQPWPAKHESPVESLTTRVAVYQPRTEKVRDQS